MTVVQFRPRRRLDPGRIGDIAQAIFESLRRPKHPEIADDLFDAVPDLTAAEVIAAIDLAHRALSGVQREVLDRLADGGDGGAA